MHAALLILTLLPWQDSTPPDSWLGGANGTTQAKDALAFGYPVPALDAIQRRAFAVGNAFFKDNWVAAPGTTTGRDGLGPLFNARSCSSCHLRDGRGRPPHPGEQDLPGLILRIGVPGEGGDVPHPEYGEQLGDHAVHGVAPEARLVIEEHAIQGSYGDGRTFELIRPGYRLEDPAHGPLGEDLRLGARVASQLIGLGLLEAVPEEDLVAHADPEDLDEDGISGRIHLVLDRRTGERRAGRFGWKATQPSVEQQVAAAFVNDIGITSSLFPDEALGARQADEIEFSSGGDPELSDRQLERVTFYSQVLAVPAQRDPQAPRVQRGRELFDELACATCHRPTLRTGGSAVIEAFTFQTVHPFTDLLLHDMGPGLADGKTDGDATPAEWRTPPLWGIGLFEAVNGHTRYLHDGRARDLAEAILWHGGEAEASREAFRLLPAEDRGALLAFLGSL